MRCDTADRAGLQYRQRRGERIVRFLLCLLYTDYSDECDTGRNGALHQHFPPALICRWLIAADRTCSDLL